MEHRDPASYDEASFTPDIASHCDTLSDHIAEALAAEWPSRADVSARPSVLKLIHRVIARLQSADLLDPHSHGSRMDGREMLAKMLAEVIDAPDPRLMAHCIDFVLETGIQLGMSETEIAARFGVTRATVSNYCVALKATFRAGRPARGMKSESAVTSYRRARSGRSNRKPCEPWQFANRFKAKLQKL